MQAAETAQSVPPKPDLSPADRRLLNSQLPPGHRCVVLQLPGGARRVAVERLPRSGAGRRPSRPVFIPPAPFQYAALDRAKLEAALARHLPRKLEPSALLTVGTRVFEAFGVKIKGFVGGLRKFFGRKG